MNKTRNQWEVTIISERKSNFRLLKDKKILAILDGDTDFGKLEIDGAPCDISIRMPYLSGPTLCSISNRFGLSVTYGWNGGAQSRWMYLDDLLEYCIENERESELLAFLFSKEQFVDILKRCDSDIIEYAYNKITGTIIKKINGILYFSENELIRCGTSFMIRKLGTMVTVETPSVKKIDRHYITDISERAMKDVIEGNYDSAVTKSRTLLEEVFCYVIEHKGQEPVQNGDIKKLYNQVKDLFNMHQSKELDKRINGLLSGLEKVLEAIAEMRNKNSDSHGVGTKRINISTHHARLFVNSAMTMADFILEVCENQK